MNGSVVVLAVMLIACALASAATTSTTTTTTAPTSASLTPQSLRCEYRTDPLGIDVPKARLTWSLVSSRRAQRQTAYHLLVATSQALLAQDKGDLWDTGKLSSDQSVHVPYAGKPLASAQQCFWKVRAWDASDQRSAWSAPATWTMGMLAPDDWQAKWLTADGAIPADKAGHTSTLLRRAFRVKPNLRRAIAFVCGLGHYELTINGSKSGEDLLAPGWTNYRKTALYDTHDVTAMLKPGADNAVGIMLGNGMYNVVGGRYVKFKGSFGPQKAIAQLRLEYADGTVETVGTDEQWQVAAGPITFSCVYGGEDHDARLEPRGWNESGFDASGSPGWVAARVTEGPGGALRGVTYAAPPIRAFDVLKPVARKELKSGVVVYDLGQNASLVPRLTVTGAAAGAVVRITPAELIKPDGSIDRQSVGNKPAYWQYTARGDARETWFPRFFYHGCRYLQVETIAPDGKPAPIDVGVEGVVVHSSAQPVGEFESSSELLNRTRTLVRWAQRSNLVSVITDCPHRERLGWLEQYHLNGPSLRYEFGLASLFAKGMGDMADAQLDNGLVPDIAPEFTKFNGGFRDSPEWGSAVIIAAWQQYLFDGDVDLLRRHYGAMKRYAHYLAGKAKADIVDHGLGDWYDIGPKPPGVAQLTPIALTATATYYQDLTILEKVARLLGNDADATSFADRAADVKRAFNAKFFDREKRRYATGSQTAQAMPLFLGLADDEHRRAVVDALVRDVRERDNAVTAGDVGHYYLLRALAGAGRSDVVYDLHGSGRADRPGYAMILAKGATSLTEAWDARRGSSHNHFMLGHIVEWLYHDVAGIQPTEEGPGFAKVVIRPQVAGDLTWARASYNSLRGPIRSGWKIDGDTITLDVSLPPGTTALVHVPTTGAVREGGKPVNEAEGVRPVERAAAAGERVFEIGSGDYSFSAPFTRPAPAPATATTTAPAATTGAAR